jgi:hypothetical protein
MTIRGTLVLLTAAIVLPTVAVRALERATVRLEDTDSWSRSGRCEVQYYNTCTGWVYWHLEGLGAHVGVLVDRCDGYSLLEQTTLYTASTGYTQENSLVSIHEVDADGVPIFPALAVRAVPYLCSAGSGYPCEEWRTLTWDVEVPSTFMFLYTQASSWTGSRIYFDHPAAGPTGPQACGYCYPTTRVGRTYYWPGAITGPGEVVNDGTCDSELLLHCTLAPGATSVDPGNSRSWGAVKALYR